MLANNITTPSKKNATVLLSGGIDSAACAVFLKEQGFTVKGVFVDFGQAAAEQEQLAVSRIQALLDIELQVIKVSSSQSFGAGELAGRNAFLIMTAIFLGQIKRGLLAIGIHSGTPYYDCSPGFVDLMKKVAEEHTAGKVTISAPFVSWDKSKILHYFTSRGLLVKETYSCEAGAPQPCGACASCRDRSALGC